jgi:hypothetical protein
MITSQEAKQAISEFYKKQKEDFEASKEQILEFHDIVIRHVTKNGDRYYDIDKLSDLVGYKNYGLDKLTRDLANLNHWFINEITEEFKKLGFSTIGTRIIFVEQGE